MGRTLDQQVAHVRRVHDLHPVLAAILLQQLRRGGQDTVIPWMDVHCTLLCVFVCQLVGDRSVFIQAAVDLQQTVVYALQEESIETDCVSYEKSHQLLLASDRELQRIFGE